MSSDARVQQLLAKMKRESEERAETMREFARENPGVLEAWGFAEAEDRQRETTKREHESCVWWLKSTGLSSRAAELWGEGLRETPAVSAARTYLESGKVYLTLMGVTGAGKTVATADVLLSGRKMFWRTDEPRPMFVRVVELARLSDFGAEDRVRMDAVRRSPVLVVDDLGTEMLHDAWRPRFDELMDIRYGERLRTVFTTNLDLKTIRTRYGARFADRLRDDGLIASCGDKSLRGDAGP